MSEQTVLVCDDEPGVRFAIEETLEALGVRVLSAEDGAKALTLIAEADVLITDLMMPKMDGFGLLAAPRAAEPDLPVIMLTARGSERAAVQALKQGAYDYMGKPFSVDELRTCVGRALETRALRRRAAQLDVQRTLGKSVIGESPGFLRVMADARRVGRRDVTILVRGETGTGKELVAGVLHASSPRRDKPCVRFNCAALAEGLAEAELFGHEKGSFTGAITARRGYFRQADGGALVLDEVAELSAAVQGKLLRALQEREVQPVGAQQAVKVDVRVVACMHRDLHAEVHAGRFREDLFYRLAVVELMVPPLRERTSDIPLLIEAFRAQSASRFDLGDVRLSPELVTALAARSWPGNVRELENAIARLLALAEPGEELGADLVQRLAPLDAPAPALTPPANTTPEGPLRQAVGAYERTLVQRKLEEAAGNQSEAARRLGISRMTLIEKMKRNGPK